MDYIIVKHYIADLDEDYREINMSKINSLLDKMKDYAKSTGKELLYAVMSEYCLGFPVKPDNFADVEYTGVLTVDEKKSYAKFLKLMSYNEEYNARSDRMRRYPMLKLIRFRKITDEILTL